MKIKRAVMKEFEIKHPFEKNLGFLYGTIFTGKAHSSDADSRNVCIFAEGEVDRSPTGTGVSARLAIEHNKGRLGVNKPFVVESILGTRFRGQVVEQSLYGPYPAVIPQVEGTAHFTGQHTFYIDPSDPLKDGFIFRQDAR